MNSSTGPFHVATDAGNGYLKAANGSIYGSRPLISELVAAELGTWFGLKIPPFAIIPECNIELITTLGEPAIGPCFFSSAIVGTPRDGGDTFLSKLYNFDDVAKIVIFDTWILNWDRCGDGDPNSDNLLYRQHPHSRKYDIVPIDHGWAFDQEFPVAMPSDDAIENNCVYGKFPEFDQYLDVKGSLRRALNGLASLQRDHVGEIVNSVPPQWGLGVGASASLVELICRRAEYVVNTIEARLVDDPEIPGLI